MSKAAYIGVDGVARKVKKMYIGVDDVARKVKKAYIGVDGVARLFYSSVSSILEENDWATIKAVGAAGEGANYWSVGDCKAVSINGTIDGYAFNNVTVYCYIIGFNHNESIEGKGIHFMFGKTAASGGVDIAFGNGGAYGTSGNAFKMNTGATNNGGWSASYMCNTICPAFLNALPSELQNAISACMKYTDNTGGGSETASNVTSSASKVWLPSEFEVQGTRTYANSAEKNYQKRYAYWANGNKKIKYMSNDTATACAWWTRSVRSLNNSTNSFCLVNATGSAGVNPANTSRFFAPCFKAA